MLTIHFKDEEVDDAPDWAKYYGYEKDTEKWYFYADHPDTIEDSDPSPLYWINRDRNCLKDLLTGDKQYEAIMDCS